MLFFLEYTVINFLYFLGNCIKAPFSRLSRHRLTTMLDAMKYPFFGKKCVALSQLLKNDELMLQIAPVKAREHNVTSFELLTICALLKDNELKNIFEIGTFDGRTTRAIALNLPEEGRVFTLNLPDATAAVSLQTSAVDVNLASKVRSGERFLNTPEQSKIEQLWGDSAQFNFSNYLGKMDAVFIDGAHSFEYAQNDTRAAMQLIKAEGGIIIWHDAHLYGVVKFLKQWINKHKYPVYFVKETSIAVMAIRNNTPIEWEQLSN